MKFISLDSSHRGESNKPKFVKIQSLDRLKTGVCRITKFESTPEIRNSGRNLHINHISGFVHFALKGVTEMIFIISVTQNCFVIPKNHLIDDHLTK